MPDASIILQPQYFDYLPWAVQLHQEIIELLGNSLLYRCSIVNTSRAFFDKSYVMFKTIVSSIIAVISVIFSNCFTAEQNLYFIATAFDSYHF